MSVQVPGPDQTRVETWIAPCLRVLVPFVELAREEYGFYIAFCENGLGRRKDKETANLDIDAQ